MPMKVPATVVSYHIHQLTDYINWIYFFHAWGFQPRYAQIAQVHACAACRQAWLDRLPEDERHKGAEAITLYADALLMLADFDSKYKIKAIYRLTDAYSDGDNLLLDQYVFPLLRQQHVPASASDAVYLCLSDFVRPLSQGIPDTVGVFAVTVEHEMEEQYAEDNYRHMLAKILCERLAEAGAERLHQFVRNKVWAYTSDEDMSIDQMLNEEYQGIRPAVGYPSLPDLSVNFLLDEMLGFHQIGISLTEHGMMQPRASVSGLMFAHPAAKYFSIGKISEEQLHDYARRRHLEVDTVRKYLSSHL